MQKFSVIGYTVKTSIVLATFCAFLLAGCGGNGSSPAPNTTSFAVNAAITNFNATSLSVTLTGTYNNTSLSNVATNIQASTNQSFLGQVANTSNSTNSLSQDGMIVSYSTLTNYFSVSPYKNLGAVAVDRYTVYANQAALPATATIGMSGNFDTGIEYSDSTQTTILDTFVETWSLQASSTSNTAALCIKTSFTAVTVTETSSISTVCLNIDSNGNILGMKQIDSIGGTPVTLTSTKIITLPGAPTIDLVFPGAGSATINFTPPANYGGAAITGYTITATPETPTLAGVITATGTSSPMTINYLNGGIAYTFTITATNSLGTGASVTSTSATPTVGPAFYVASTLAGSGSVGSNDGIGSAASFNAPNAVALDNNGNVYVADTGNNEIRMITPSGVVSTLAGSPTLTGDRNGTGAYALFDGPRGVALDSSGNIYVADEFNYAIRKITPTGVVSTFSGAGVNAMYQPHGVTVDSSDNIYVVDTNDNQIRMITPAGVATILAGAGSGTQGYINGTGTAAHFHFPTGAAVDNSGNFFVSDASNNSIRKITQAGVVSTFAGVIIDGTGTGASFYQPQGVAVDSSGNVYVADGNNEIRMVTSAGTVSTLAGSSTSYGNTNGLGVLASFKGGNGIAVDSSGNVYLADTGNNEIRKLTLVH